MVKITFLSIVSTVLFLFQSQAQQLLEWKIMHPKTKKWMDLGTKGSVQEALIASGELPDPFVGMNESKFTWIEAENSRTDSVNHHKENIIGNTAEIEKAVEYTNKYPDIVRPNLQNRCQQLPQNFYFLKNSENCVIQFLLGS